MEKVIKQVSEERLTKRKTQEELNKIITPEIKKNKILIQRWFRSDRDSIQKNRPRLGMLSNIFEEYGVLDPRNWPPGVPYDSIYYLGDLSSLQFFSEKLRLPTNQRLQGHFIKKFGEDVVLVADTTTNDNETNSKASKIPEFQWPKDIHLKDEDIHKYIYAVTGLDQYTTVRLLKIYFSHIHPLLPVIDKTAFLKQYRDRVKTYPSGELLNAMFGAAARFAECECLEPRRKMLPSDAIWDVPVGWSNKFFDQAEYIISKWSTIPTNSMVQAIILILNFRSDRDFKSSACWQLGGFAIRLAQLLGLHRNCDDWDVSRNEKETRKRIWWALYITDRFQTALLGRPINLRDEDNNVPYPDAGADIEEVMDAYEEDKERIQNNEVFPRFPSLTTPYDQTQNNNRRPQIYELFIQFIKLSQILGHILQGLHSPKAKKYSLEHGSDGLITRLDYELTEWRYAFPTALKKINLPDFNEKVGHFAPAIASVLLFYFSVLITLHQPFIRRGAILSRSSYTSQRICSSAATRGMRIATQLSVWNFLMCPYSFTLYPVMQFGLIQMYNGKHPDPQISMPARLSLRSGRDLLMKLQHMSRTAQRMYNVFSVIVESADLDMTEEEEGSEMAYIMERNLAEEESHLEENIRQFREKKKRENPDRPNMRGIINCLMNIKTDFRNLCPPHKGKEKATMADASQQKQSGPDSLSFDLNEEAFTLTQFGIDTTNDSSALDYIFQNVNTLSEFTENINELTQIEQQQGSLNSASPLTTTMPAVVLDQEQSANTIFRTDPGNVFWEFPASFNWDQLNEWITHNLNDMTT
ncbi:MAG: fungal-specific transcription factor domain-containing protein [Benjaminiella poitrasii]|nr:MAG: fungal-specific transcription factor domain-containing protein [Benjaminiella poitrasii]